MQSARPKRISAFYPIIIALYPPLSLLASNILQIRIVDSIRSLLVFLILAIGVYLITWWIVKDEHKAAFIAAVIILLFSSYGQFYTILKQPDVLSGVLGRHRYLAPLWLVLIIGSIWLISRSKSSLKRVTSGLNWVSLALIALPLINIGNFAWQTAHNQAANAESTNLITKSSTAVSTTKPDVYYIILDMYGRDDILKDKFHYNNEAFIKQLEELGFFVARCSVTNYNMTELSLASSFNMNFLDTLGDQYQAGSKDRSGLPSLIHQSAVRKIFEGLGYQFINYETGFTFTEIRDADQFLIPPKNNASTFSDSIRLNGFESMLVRTTVVSLVADAQAKWLHPVTDALDTRKQHIERELFLLDTLPNLPQEESPKFVYAHILIPHPPFVFSKDGVNLSFPGNDGATTYGPSAKDYAVGYKNQLDYINARIIPILEKIIRDSKTPPIIILQGDHGVDPKRSFILNAYYLPDGKASALYPAISPVNSFRVVLNQYFSGNYPLLPDTNYASRDKTPFDFEIIQNTRICE